VTVFSRMSVCIIKRHILIRDMLVRYTKWINIACQGWKYVLHLGPLGNKVSV